MFNVGDVATAISMITVVDGATPVSTLGNDTVMNVGIAHEDVLTALCENYGQDAKTGELLYEI